KLGGLSDLWNLVLQPHGPGKYVFDIGCEQYGEYRKQEQPVDTEQKGENIFSGESEAMEKVLLLLLFML
ncbi:hypothetical protein ILYODFUR_038724, partial [Ilyodon furcidens]